MHIFRYGQFSLFEITYRSALIYANLCDDGAGRIKRSEAYDGLDPSEKGAVSYFLGLTLAKAFAERELDVPWLMHLDVYRKELAPVLSGQSRPDLVGQTTGGSWVVIEAKGRTSTTIVSNSSLAIPGRAVAAADFICHSRGSGLSRDTIARFGHGWRATRARRCFRLPAQSTGPRRLKTPT